MTCRSILGLVPRPGAIVDGSIRWRGEELVGADDRRLRRVRGGEIGMIFQDPASALNPVYTIGSQIVETIVTHTTRGRAAARRDVVDLLGERRDPVSDASAPRPTRTSSAAACGSGR